MSFLEDVKRRTPHRGQMIQPLFDKVAGYSDFRRAAEATSTQYRMWTSGNPDGVLGALRAAIEAICFWTANTSLQPTMPTFSQLLVRTAMLMNGADATLNAIVDATSSQIAAGLGEAALDVSTAIILSHSTSSPISLHGRLLIRDIMQLHVADAPRVFADKDADHGRMETIVRLGRRVETAIANIIAASANTEHQQALDLPMTDAIMEDIGLDAATAAAVGLGTGNEVVGSSDAAKLDTLDLTGGADDALQLNIDAALAGAPQQDTTGMVGGGANQDDGQLPPGEDDIFGDLLVDDYNLNF